MTYRSNVSNPPAKHKETPRSLMVKSLKTKDKKKKKRENPQMSTIQENFLQRWKNSTSTMPNLETTSHVCI